MSSYDELPAIIGEMKRAAIDSFMAEQGWLPHIIEDSYYSLWGFVGQSSYIRPEPDGSEGGEPVNFIAATESMAPSFDSIRSTIDAHTSPWLELPDGAGCSVPQQSVSTTAAIFGASGTGGSVQDNGEITTSNQTVSDVLINHIQGSFVGPFHDKYYSQFSKVVSGLGAACAILEINYAAQSRIWPATRADATTICVNARDTLKAKAGQAADEFGAVVLTVIGAVAGVVSSVVTAGAATPAVAALVGISAAATSTMAALEAQATISGNSHSEILDSLGEALGKLNSGVASQENALNTMMASAVDTIDGDLPSFNLDAFILQSYPGAADTLSMQRWNTQMISTNMTRIAAALGSAESALGSAPTTNPTTRDSSIGAGANGTHVEAQELHLLAARCLSLTKAEYERGQKLFEATVADYFDADADATTLVNRLAAEEILTEDMGL